MHRHALALLWKGVLIKPPAASVNPIVNLDLLTGTVNFTHIKESFSLMPIAYYSSLQ